MEYPENVQKELDQINALLELVVVAFNSDYPEIALRAYGAALALRLQGNRVGVHLVIVSQDPEAKERSQSLGDFLFLKTERHMVGMLTRFLDRDALARLCKLDVEVVGGWGGSLPYKLPNRQPKTEDELNDELRKLFPAEKHGPLYNYILHLEDKPTLEDVFPGQISWKGEAHAPVS